jgi:hypothetical protein
VCAAHSVPIIPYGQGTSVEGHIQAHRGGVAVSVSQGLSCAGTHAYYYLWSVWCPVKPDPWHMCRLIWCPCRQLRCPRSWS